MQIQCWWRDCRCNWPPPHCGSLGKYNSNSFFFLFVFLLFRSDHPCGSQHCQCVNSTLHEDLSHAELSRTQQIVRCSFTTSNAPKALFSLYMLLTHPSPQEVNSSLIVHKCLSFELQKVNLTSTYPVELNRRSAICAQDHHCPLSSGGGAVILRHGFIRLG